MCTKPMEKLVRQGGNSKEAQSIDPITDEIGREGNSSEACKTLIRRDLLSRPI